VLEGDSRENPRNPAFSHTTTALASDDVRMSDERSADMQDLSVRELKTEIDGRFRDLRAEIDTRFAAVDARFDAVDCRFDTVDRRFDRLETRITEGEATTRRHFDIVAESLRAEIRLRHQGTDARVDNHERRIQALEKRRR
jgi:hypothetical protein